MTYRANDLIEQMTYRTNDHRANGNRADVVAPWTSIYLGFQDALCISRLGQVYIQICKMYNAYEGQVKDISRFARCTSRLGQVYIQGCKMQVQDKYISIIQVCKMHIKARTSIYPVRMTEDTVVTRTSVPEDKVINP